MIEIKKVSKRFDKIEAVSVLLKRDRFLVFLERMVQERVHFFE